LFEAECAKDREDRNNDCLFLDSLTDYKTCLEIFASNDLVNQDNVALTEYVTCYKYCFTISENI
jgi:hypothetical protein